MIELYDGMVFLISVAIGAWVQAISGFAFGLIVIAIVQLTGTMTIKEAAAAISILAFANVVISLQHTFRHIDRRLFTRLIVGQLPAIGVGVWFLGYLSVQATSVLELIFGLFLIVSGTALAINPTPLALRSRDASIISAGLMGGIFGGMFAASGPIIGWFAYRQPIPIAAIRASLLAMLGVTTLARTAIVAVDGVFTVDLAIWIAVAIPFVIAFTYLGRNVGQGFGDRHFRRVIFILVLVVGCWIVGSALLRF